jgi:S-ribosylhomocysteine lyase LuxS involved in autoinducer biosynthesis
MKNRKKIINAITDCTLEKIDLATMEHIASMNNEELVQYLAHELYSLKYSYSSLLDKSIEDQETMLEKIKELEIKLAIKERC